MAFQPRPEPRPDSRLWNLFGYIAVAVLTAAAVFVVWTILELIKAAA